MTNDNLPVYLNFKPEVEDVRAILTSAKAMGFSPQSWMRLASNHYLSYMRRVAQMPENATQARVLLWAGGAMQAADLLIAEAVKAKVGHCVAAIQTLVDDALANGRELAATRYQECRDAIQEVPT